MPATKPQPIKKKTTDQRKTAHTKKGLTTEEKEKAKALHATGLSNREIARQLGVNEARIRRLWKNLTPQEESSLEWMRVKQQVTFIERAYGEIWESLKLLPKKRDDASYKDVVWGIAVLADKIAAIPHAPPNKNSRDLQDYIRALVAAECIEPMIIDKEFGDSWNKDLPPEERKRTDWLEKVGLIQLEKPEHEPKPNPPPKAKSWWEIQKEDKARREEIEWQEFQAWKKEKASATSDPPSPPKPT